MFVIWSNFQYHPDVYRGNNWRFTILGRWGWRVWWRNISKNLEKWKKRWVDGTNFNLGCFPSSGTHLLTFRGYMPLLIHHNILIIWNSLWIVLHIIICVLFFVFVWLQVIQNPKNYGALKCIAGIEDLVLRKQMESLESILLSMNQTL